MTPPLSQQDYERLHGVMRAVLDGAGAHTTQACLFFSVVGGYLLEKYHKLNTTPLAGAALYGLGGDPPTVLTFGRFEDEVLVSDRAAFHAWIQVGDWAIDLMAPIFPENAAERGIRVPVPRRSFQRHVDTMASTLEDLEVADTFLLVPDAPLTNALVSASLRRPATADLANVCATWYRPYPQPMDEELILGSSDGAPRVMRLPTVSLEGTW